MEFVEPQALPAFLDPALDFLADRLPGPLYDAVFNILSYGLLLLSGILSLLSSLPSWKPWEWDAQSLLPPLISALAAYYVLYTMYRTTGWMIKLGIRMVEWTVLVALIFSGIGWLLGTNGMNGNVGNFIRELVNGRGNDRNMHGNRFGGAGGANRPRPWDRFETHTQWQYSENEAQDDVDVQSVIQQVFVTVTRAFGLLDGAAGGILQNLAGMTTEGGTGNGDRNSDRGGQSSNTRQRTRVQPKRKVKTSAQRRTRSR